MIDLKDIDFNESSLDVFEHISNDVMLKISEIYQTEGVVEVYITCKGVYSVKIEGQNDVIRKYYDDGEIIFLEIEDNCLEMLVCWRDYQKAFSSQDVYYMYQISYEKIESVVVEGKNERPGSAIGSNDSFESWFLSKKIVVETKPSKVFNFLEFFCEL